MGREGRKMPVTGNLIISDIMTSSVVVGEPNEPIRQVALKMKKNSISSVVIVNRRRQPIGIVSESDIVRKLMISRKSILFSHRAKSIMSHPVCTIEKDRKIEEAAKLMMDKNITKLCVLGADGSIIGIVTDTDIMRTAGDMSQRLRPPNKTDMAVKDALMLLSSNKLLTHEHGRRCYRLLKPVLYADERTILEVKQSVARNIAPVRIIATNQRLIIAKPSFWGLYAGHNLISSTKYVTIPYNNINSVTMSHGFGLASLHVHLSSGPNAEVDEIMGLRKREAEAVFGFLEKIVEYMVGRDHLEKTAAQPPNVQEHGHTHVSMERARRIVKENNTRFVWFGIEPAEFAADALCIDRSGIYKVPDIYRIMDMPRPELTQYENCVLVCYNGAMSGRVSKFLMDSHGINSYVLRGGIEAVAKELSK